VPRPVDDLVFEEEALDVVAPVFDLRVADLFEASVTLGTDFDRVIGAVFERERVVFPVLLAVGGTGPPPTVTVLFVENRADAARIRVDELVDRRRLPPAG